MNKPLNHAKWIKLWADGAKIQYKTGAGNWVDVVSFNSMVHKDIEYRVKPEVEEPWKPKLRDEYYAIYISFGEIEIACNKWNNDSIDNKRYSKGNCFKTKKEAKQAAERVEAAMKGDLKGSTYENSNVGSGLDLNALAGKIIALESENNDLKIRNENLHEEKEVLISKQTELDGKQLTNGEKALIRALRNVKIAHVPNVGDAHMSFIKDGKLDCECRFVGFTSHIAYEENVIAALKKIKLEQDKQ